MWMSLSASLYVCVLQKEVNSEAYGPTMAELEKQIAAHNILHKEIEAYNTQLSPDSTSSKVSHIPSTQTTRQTSFFKVCRPQSSRLRLRGRTHILAGENIPNLVRSIRRLFPIRTPRQTKHTIIKPVSGHISYSTGRSFRNQCLKWAQLNKKA